MSSSNHIHNVAIVGAGGQIGSYIVKSLVAGGKHKITALTRPDSTNTLPEGVTGRKVNYDDHADMTSALTGIDALVITMSVTAPPDQQDKILDAAFAAKVPWIIPNYWSTNGRNDKLGEDIMLGPAQKKIREKIAASGTSSWIAVACGFWYAYSLAGGYMRMGPEMYGFDLVNRTVTFFDEGTNKINTSTYDQVGRAVASLLSLPIEAEGGNTPHVSQWKNDFLFISSFKVSQRDMFESVKRVSHTTDADWKITHEKSAERYEEGKARVMKGDRAGFGRMLYSRVMYPTGEGNFEDKFGLANKALGLPEESIDEDTAKAFEMAKEAGRPYEEGAKVHAT